MMEEKVDATVADFDAHFEKLLAAGEDGGGKVKLLLFLADRDASSDLTWCPDCNVAEPVIYEKVEALGRDVVLLRAYVGDKPTWRDPAHPWRVDPRFRLTGVPTLNQVGEWRRGGAARGRRGPPRRQDRRRPQRRLLHRQLKQTQQLLLSLGIHLI